MTYRKPSVPADAYDEFNRAVEKLGYGKRGQKWELLKRLSAYAIEHAPIFQR